MNYDTFVDMVAQRAGVDSDTAVDLSRGTLEVLADRLTSGEVMDLAAQLPQPLQATMQGPADAANRSGRRSSSTGRRSARTSTRRRRVPGSGPS